MNARVAQAVNSTKNFVKRHQTALAVTATATVCTVVHIMIIDDNNKFLDEHGLLEERYCLDEED